MPTVVIAVTSTAWVSHDPGADTVIGYENTDPLNRVVVVISATAPTATGGSEVGHTLAPKEWRDFNFKPGEKGWLKSVSGRATVTAL